ncbi:hypothetical protein [Denitrobacterium detoxificans]|jgi:hypothetical protein|uniref:hypothetical protein n=1 Tax=Denitrobacterium detoxificans TaxID=79604 RepID=UPI0026EC0D61|nr:hypothetical protein [Denitrobacterium detoxificans]MBE6466075.1 hypothetical protein [Denitrobacterium detoxificans]
MRLNACKSTITHHTTLSFRSATLFACLSAAALMCALFLGGCGPKGHQIVSPTKECTSCHGEKTTYGTTAHNDALHSNNTVTVSTKADKVSVCTPLFTSADGTAYTPILDHVENVEGGKVTLQLDDGVWAICLDNGDSSVGQIVVVSSDESDSATITL